MTSVSVNTWAVIVAGVVNMVIGAIWYSKALFAKPWMKAVGKSETELRAGAQPLMYLYMFVGTLVTGYILAHFVAYTGSMSAKDGALTGFWAWLGFVAPSYLSLKIFEDRSWELYFINVGYYLVALVSMGAILAVWK